MATPESLPSDLRAVRDRLAAALTAELCRVLEGRVERIDGQITEAALRLAVAARRNRGDLVAQAADRLSLEIQGAGLVARDGMGSALSYLLYSGVNFLFEGAAAGLAGVEAGPR
jgi:hypothetical protein